MPTNAPQHHKERLRDFKETCKRQKKLKQEFVINLPYGKRQKKRHTAAYFKYSNCTDNSILHTCGNQHKKI